MLLLENDHVIQPGMKLIIFQYHQYFILYISQQFVNVCQLVPSSYSPVC